MAACGGPPDSSRVARTARSWAATADFVTDRREHDAVSRRFALLTLDRAGSELQGVAETAAQLPDSASRRATLLSTVGEIRRTVAALDSAAAHGDRTAAARIAVQLASATAQMDTLGTQLEQEQQRQSQRR